MSNSLGSSGLNSGSNFASSSSDMDKADLLLNPWIRFKHGTFNLELKLKADTEAMKAKSRRANDRIFGLVAITLT